MRRILIVALGLGALAGLAGCGDEDPTEVGAPLIGEGVRTFEAVLDPADFLESDTTFDGIGSLRSASFRMVAHEFGGELDAHAIFKAHIPETVTYQDTAGTTVTDSTPDFGSGRLTMIIDTVASSGPAELEVLPLAESWDPESVTWTARYDTAGPSEPWTEPGGTPADVAVGVGLWEGGDTLVIPIAASAAVLWKDSAAADRGALVRSVTTGSRLFIRSMSLEFDVLTEEPTDTTETRGSLGNVTLIASPEPSAAADSVLRVGGLPIWRSFLHFRPIESISLDCSAAIGASCSVPLSSVDINLATLILSPLPAGAFRTERPIRIEGRAVLEAEGIPLIRSPLSAAMGLMEDTIPRIYFNTPPAGATVQVPITSYIGRLVSPPEDQEPWQWLALTAVGERQPGFETFGYTAFRSVTSSDPPRLRLVVTASDSDLQR